ncbi:tRNA (adenosine(37)-N6)-dimethylallyltransferase MiaA [Thermosulfuriphilus sp.]
MIRIIVICGPTGVGKTSFSIRLAQAIPAEIIGADSLQVYRHLDIGTAKPTLEERTQVPHHLVDILEPHEPFNAAMFAELAQKAIFEITSRSRVPLVVGGTGLYIKALLYGLAPLEGEVDPVRKKLERECRIQGLANLYERLRNLDPEAAARISPSDRIRILRALEIYELTGRPASQIWEEHGFTSARYRALKIGLILPREELYRRIEERTRKMIDEGLVEEVRRLLARGFSPELKPLRSIGYRQIIAHLQGEIGLEEAVAEITKETKRYAKRQITWFKADREIKWLSPTKVRTAIEMARRFLECEHP